MKIAENNETPIFSKSSVDVVMAAGPPQARDPALPRLDLRRSSSTNTHSDQNACIRAINPCNSLLTKQNLDLHNPSERWINNMQRWSGCSIQSRSSTPDTVIFKGSRPSSLTQETPCAKHPDSPASKLKSPPTTPSLLVSPLQTPTIPFTTASPPSSPPFVTSNQQNVLSSVDSSPLFSPLKIISPLPPNELLRFTFPSPISSSVSLERDTSLSDPEEIFGNLKTPTTETSLERLLTDLSPKNLEGDIEKQDSICRLDLPELSGFPENRKLDFVTSFSDSYLVERCFCKDVEVKGLAKDTNKEEATMTSHVELVDVGVQTLSPIGSWWTLRRNISSSNIGSPSILGSPPGSRLNLRSQIGSNSNLVSLSVSMLPVNSKEDVSKVGKEDPLWESSSDVDLERRRSCLKSPGEELGRRSSMKQVQWDEDGMTWDVHGASIDPEELTTAIRKHLEQKYNEELKTPKPLRKSSKKKRAPKPPVFLKPPVILKEGTCQGKTKEDGVEREMGAYITESKEEEELEVYRKGVRSKSPSLGSAQSRKRSVIRSFKKPGCCGASRKAED